MIVVVAALMSPCRLEKVSVEVVQKETPPILNQMEFSGWVIYKSDLMIVGVWPHQYSVDDKCIIITIHGFSF